MAASRPAACGKPASAFTNDFALAGHEARHVDCRVILGKAPAPASPGSTKPTGSDAAGTQTELRRGLADLRNRVQNLEAPVAAPTFPSRAQRRDAAAERGQPPDLDRLLESLEETTGRVLALEAIVRAPKPPPRIRVNFVDVPRPPKKEKVIEVEVV